MSDPWEARLDRLRNATLAWLEKERRPQNYVATRIGCDRSRISTFLSGAWQPTRQRSLEFVDALEQFVLGDARDYRALPLGFGEVEVMPDDLDPEEEERWLADECVRHELHRRNQLLDRFDAITALQRAGGFYFRALGISDCSGRLCGNLLGFYMSAFMRVFEDRVWTELSLPSIRRHLRWLRTAEEVAHRNALGESPTRLSADRLTNCAGTARAMAGMILRARGEAHDLACELISQGCQELVGSLRLDASLPRDERMGLVWVQEGRISIKVVIAVNALHVGDLLMQSEQPEAEETAGRLHDALSEWEPRDVAALLKRIHPEALLGHWRVDRPGFVDAVATVKEIQ